MTIRRLLVAASATLVVGCLLMVNLAGSLDVVGRVLTLAGLTGVTAAILGIASGGMER